jgi:hypothetical protein
MPKKTRRKLHPDEPRRLASVSKSPPATMPAPDVLDILRNAPKRLATREQLEKLADRWRR